jgi:hypothetical protein
MSIVSTSVASPRPIWPTTQSLSPNTRSSVAAPGCRAVSNRWYDPDRPGKTPDHRPQGHEQEQRWQGARVPEHDHRHAPGLARRDKQPDGAYPSRCRDPGPGGGHQGPRRAKDTPKP